jgi:hypothetical protein
MSRYGLTAALPAAAVMLCCACGGGGASHAGSSTSTISGHTHRYAAPVVLRAGETRRFSRSRLAQVTTLACVEDGKRVTLLVSAMGSHRPMRSTIPGGPMLRVRYLSGGSALATCS